MYTPVKLFLDICIFTFHEFILFDHIHIFIHSKTIARNFKCLSSSCRFKQGLAGNTQNTILLIITQTHPCNIQ